MKKKARAPKKKAAKPKKPKKAGPAPALDLGDYRGLVKKVDGFFARVQTRYRADMQCGAGCWDCCQSSLTVSPLEAEALRQFLAGADEALRARLAARAQALRGTEGPCPALDEDGRCAVYPARPIVCRTHGVPMRVPGRLPVVADAPDVELRVCHLNFTGRPLQEVDEECVLDLKTVSTILGVMNAKQGIENLSTRIPLGDVLFAAHRVGQ